MTDPDLCTKLIGGTVGVLGSWLVIWGGWKLASYKSDSSFEDKMKERYGKNMDQDHWGGE